MVLSCRVLLCILFSFSPVHTVETVSSASWKVRTCSALGIASRLRGGGLRAPSEFVVPSDQCPTLDAGIEAVCKIDQLFVRKGVHRWMHRRRVGARTLNVKGEDGSLLIGQWIMWDESKGNFTKLAMAADSKLMAAVHTILFHGANWTLESCVVQAINGVAIEARERAALHLRASTLGGGGEKEYLARTGLAISSFANVSVLGGSVVFCESEGVRVDDSGTLMMRGCRVSKNHIGVSVHGDCWAELRDCVLSNAAASLMVDEQSRYAVQVFMSGNQLSGTAWYGDRSPARHPLDPPDKAGDEDWSDPDIIQHLSSGARSFV